MRYILDTNVLLKNFLNYIKENELFSKEKKILVGVSGGIDSVVMCDLFNQAGFKFAIAHCNFRLRGEESDADETFVQHLSKKYQVPIYSTRFETQQYATEKKISIQMAARELRYKWMQEIRVGEGYDYVAIAHHQNDVIETFFVNLLRGTGIAGLHGIAAKKNEIVRPLLAFSRAEIETYAINNKLSFREDSSNLSDDYMRNKIRHQLIPVLKEINPNLEQTFSQTIEKIKETEVIYLQEIEQKRKELQEIISGKILFPIHKLKKLQPINAYLHGFLSFYNFNSQVIAQIAKSLDAEPGKLFYSPTHCLLKDRDTLVISVSRPETDVTTYFIKETDAMLDDPLKINISTINWEKGIKFPDSPKIAYLDADKIKFPLKVRKWQVGDFFFPLGMNKKKKLSDFFIDNKISIFDKEKIFVILSNEEIIWIAGYRIDERYKINSSTKKALILNMYNN